MKYILSLALLFSTSCMLNAMQKSTTRDYKLKVTLVDPQNEEQSSLFTQSKYYRMIQNFLLLKQFDVNIKTSPYSIEAEISKIERQIFASKIYINYNLREKNDTATPIPQEKIILLPNGSLSAESIDDISFDNQQMQIRLNISCV